jgi:hypothetical protein
MARKVELAVEVHRQTPAALIVWDAGVSVVLPKSQIEYEGDYDQLEEGDVIEIEIPEWLADREGLI